MARPRTIYLLLALVTVLAYSPLRHAAFVVFDDPDYVTENHVVQRGLTWPGVKWAFTTWHGANWHPLTWLSHMLDAELFGPNPGAQHLVNVLFHAANAVLLFLLLLRLTKKMWPAAFVAALFAWHPLHVESVAWISERKDVLSMFFGFLALLAYARYASTPVPQSKIKNPNSKIWYIWSVAFFALSLTAKPMLVTLPCILLLLDFWPLGRIPLFHNTDGPRPPVFRVVLEKAPFFLLTIGSCIVTFLAQRAEAVLTLEQYPFDLRLQNAIVSYVDYLGKTVWPANLAIIYPLPHQIPGWKYCAAAGILAAISVFTLLARRRSPYLLFGWLWFLGILVPVIGLVQVGGQALADRYSYVPLVGVFIMAAYGAADIVARFRVPKIATSVIAGIVIAGCLIVTERQLSFWQTSERLFTHALEITTENVVAHINLGVAYEQEGRRAEAEAEYRKGIALDPHRAVAHNDLANLLSDAGNRDEALKEYRETLRINPHLPLAHANLGTLLSESGDFDGAMSEFQSAARLAPDDPRPPYLMGKACLRHGQSAEAVAHFHDALRIEPNDVQTLTWLARVLAADQSPTVRNSAEAVTVAERVNSLTEGGEPFILDTLAIAYAAAGRFNESQQTVQLAIDRASAGDAKELAAAMQQRLQLYRSNQPYREDFSRAGGSK